MFEDSTPGAVDAEVITTIVVIDDDEDLLRALRFSLELDGFRVISSESGDDLVAAELPVANACMVIDYRLPEIDGLELLARLRAQGIDLPVIVITSHFSPALRRRAEAAGAVLVEKPLIGDTLLTAIRTTLAGAPSPA